jgi:alpha/beta superfamily hydrolase
LNSNTLRRTVAGPAGPLDVAIDEPRDVSVRGTALVCHPHPLHGGTLDNKVAQTLARAWVQAGWRAVRFNFRGVGGSAGAWDEGRGEVDDAMAAIAVEANDGELAIAGFSFGGYVASHVAARVSASGRAVSELVLIAPATSRFDVAPVPAGTLVVHGEHDDVVPLSATLDWARPQSLPVVVVPGGGHFFHGQLPLLKSIVLRHLGAA